MALPRIDTPTYQLKLPSTQEIIEYRPFLMKEQKIIMMAQETGDDQQMVVAMQKLVTSCTFNKINIMNLPVYDVEYMFLKIRGKSVGESVEINLICPDDNETQVPTKINLDEIEVQIDVNHNNVIDITDTIKMHMRDPMFSDATSVSGFADNTEALFKLLNKCIVKISYGDTEYQRADISDKDIEDFVDQLSSEQFEQIINFFTTAPKLRHVVEVLNPKTKVKGEVLLEGLQNFLG